MTTLLPICTLDRIDRDVLNGALVAWRHKMGAWRRPDFGPEYFHGLCHGSALVAVTAAARPISPEVQGINRDDAVELGRLCAVRPGLCRVMLRMWREFILPDLGKSWAISYQHKGWHDGDTYRFDGWIRLGASRSGTDQRSGRRGYSKVIWGFSHDPALMAERRAMVAGREVA